MQIQTRNILINVTADDFYIEAFRKIWKADPDFPACVYFENGETFAFRDFSSKTVHPYHSGTFKGIYVDYIDASCAFRTFYLIDLTTEACYLRLLPLQPMEGIKEVRWPAPFVTHVGYSVLPFRQGMILPHDETKPLQLPFNGQFCSAAAYLSMLGTVEADGACLMINETPWDSRYSVTQLFEKKENRLTFYHLPSLGKMSGRRDLKFVFFKEADYNTFAKYYRRELLEKGQLRTLQEKAVQLPAIDKLISSSFVHMGIKTFVQPDSRFYDPEAPEKNNHLTSFSQRADEMNSYYQMGMRELYLHLDGWGIAYDNGHPDVMPINQEAGGEKGLLELEKTIHRCGFLMGIHDQYRDYYHRAQTFRKEFACQNPDGTYPEHANWAGGVQNYLCASVAKDYVQRNFQYLEKMGVQLDGAYLDVFTCNELDECANPNHVMTRQACAQARARCFQYLSAHHIMPSSEELNEWAMNDIVFCHYAPYEFQMHQDEQSCGWGIPLFNLVFHDCALIPWMMDRPNDDYMLYALLNGGAPYFRRDAAYPGIDGAFTHGLVPLSEQVARCQIVSDLCRQVAKQEMLSHHFLDQTHRRQQTVFADGTTVTIDLDRGTFQITKMDQEVHL